MNPILVVTKNSEHTRIFKCGLETYRVCKIYDTFSFKIYHGNTLLGITKSNSYEKALRKILKERQQI